MIISKIQPVLSNINTINGNNYVSILLNGLPSTSDKTITTYDWRMAGIIGTGIVVNATGTLPNNTPITNTTHLTVMFSDTILLVQVTLTVTDEDGKVSTTSIGISFNGDIVNPELRFRSIQPNVVFLPNNNVEIGFIESAINLITNTNIQTGFNLYGIDYTNNGVLDDTTVDVSMVYSRVYQDECNYNQLRVNATYIGHTSIYYTTVMFNPINGNRELVIDNDTCNKLVVYSETKPYIDKWVGRVDNTNMRYLRLSANINCCVDGSLIHLLAPRYRFDISTTNCIDSGQCYIEPITNICYPRYINTITIEGISSLFIDRVEITDTVTGNIVIHNSNSFDIDYYIVPTGAPLYSRVYKVKIVTIDEFVYEFDLLQTADEGTECVITSLIDNVVYPELPQGLSYYLGLTRTEIHINSLFYHISKCDNHIQPLPDGIYYIELNDSNINSETVAECIFVNCETKCLIYKALANNCDLKIIMLYEALVYGDMCNTLSCEDKCYMYEVLRGLLSECDCLIYELEHKLPKLDTGCGCNK